jgi:hypothetical protein
VRDIVFLRASRLAARARLLPAGGLVALGPPLSGLPGGALELLVERVPLVPGRAAVLLLAF